MNILRLTVESRRGKRPFAAIVHRATRPEELKLDPEAFYMRHARRVPEGDHYEIEITEPDAAFLAENKLHSHVSEKTGAHFVCYPPQIRTPGEAEEIFGIWCLGVILQIEYQTDLNTVYSGECYDRNDMFFEVMRDKYGAQVVVADMRQS